MKNTIIANIKRNAKRVAKIKSLNTHKAIEQAKNYVVAEAKENKVCLSADEVRQMAVQIVFSM